MYETVTTLLQSGDHPLIAAFPHGAVFAFDTELRYLAAGGLGLADVGLAREDLEGFTIYEALDADTVARIEPHYRAALEGKSTTCDVPYRGHVFVQRLGPIRDATGRVVAGIGFTQNVTEARRTEEALRESEERNRMTFLHAPVGQAIVELDGHWRQVNDAVVEITGYREDQLVGMTFQDITHPDDLQLDLDHLARLIDGEIPSYRIEKRYITASGGIVHVLLAVSLVRDHAGAPQYLIGQIQDITELVNRRQALKDLMSMISHDLRTATTVVVGYSEVLLSSWDSLTDEQRVHHLRRINTASHAMQVLLDNSLTADTLESGQITAEPHDTPVLDVVHSALDALAIEADAVDTRGVGSEVVLADPVHLHQILSNLISNSRKYGGGSISVAAEVDGAEVVIRVADDGPGVEPAFVPHLFDRFSRTPSSRRGTQRGTGLGLSIVRDLVVLNHGTVNYQDCPGGGAQFTVRLPVGHVAASS